MLKHYFALTKPKIALLLLISTLAGMLAAGAGRIPILDALLVLSGGYLCAGGAGAFNCYLDRDLDTLMTRTKRRPIPAGHISPRNALIFSILITMLSVPILYMVSTLVMLLSMVAWLYYVLIYSIYLKSRTDQNVVIGGAAGAFPPVIGWAAITGGVDATAIAMFMIVFFWTPPHAYALMLIVKDDYKRVNIPMLPSVRSEKETVRQILVYGVVLLLVTVIPGLLNLFGILYLLVAIPLGCLFVILAANLYISMEISSASRLYRYSTYYLAFLFLGMVLDRALLV